MISYLWPIRYTSAAQMQLALWRHRYNFQHKCRAHARLEEFMQALVERIRSEGRNLGRGILKVDGFINHQLDPLLTMEMGREFARRFAEAGVMGITKIITAEVSGIAPALTTGIVLGV